MPQLKDRPANAPEIATRVMQEEDEDLEALAQASDLARLGYTVAGDGYARQRERVCGGGLLFFETWYLAQCGISSEVLPTLDAKERLPAHELDCAGGTHRSATVLGSVYVVPLCIFA